MASTKAEFMKKKIKYKPQFWAQTYGQTEKLTYGSFMIFDGSDISKHAQRQTGREWIFRNMFGLSVCLL